jgi:uncharacterized protein YbbK (DUF523 family)
MKKKNDYLIISMCLLNILCRYNAEYSKYKLSKENLDKLTDLYNLIPVCPEQLSGFSTPRIPSEINGGDGMDIVNKKKNVYVIDKNGNDNTSKFLKGANEVYKLVKAFEVKKMIVHPKSPSCSYKVIYNGNFENKLRDGIGVTTAFLKEKIEMEIIEVTDIEKFLI